MVLYSDVRLESPYVMAAYVALVEKGLSFELRPVDLAAGEQHRPEFAGPSLTARVPALEHDGFWLSESLAIAEYLEEMFPEPPLFPADRRDRARARQIMGWVRSDLMPLREERPTTTIFVAPTSTPLTPAAQRSADKLVRVASAVVGDRPFLFERFTLADVDLALALHRLLANGDPVPDALSRYARGVFERPSLRKYLALPR